MFVCSRILCVKLFISIFFNVERDFLYIKVVLWVKTFFVC